MINNSYSASCYIENNKGQYHIECDMQTDNAACYAEYDGDSFVDGFNYIIDELTVQINEASVEPEPEPQSTEDRIKSLEQMVYDLREERAALVNELQQYKNKNTEKQAYRHSNEYYNDLFDKIILNLRG